MIVEDNKASITNNRKDLIALECLENQLWRWPGRATINMAREATFDADTSSIYGEQKHMFKDVSSTTENVIGNQF